MLAPITILYLLASAVPVATATQTPNSTASSGVYLTAADYANGALTDAGSCQASSFKVAVHDVLNGPYIEVSRGSDKKHVRLKNEIFGLRMCDGHDYRLSANRPARFVAKGDLYVYGVERPVSQGKGFRVTVSYYFSSGAGGEVRTLTLEHLQEAFAANHRFIDSLDRLSEQDLAQFDKLVLFLALYCAALLVFTAFALGPRPLHHDMTEAWAWGKEFQLGYAKHPPMSAWLTGLWFTVLPRTDLSFYLLSTLNLAAALTGVWALAGLFLEARGRLAAVLLLALTPSFNVWAMKFNANAPLLSTWPWTTYFFLRSLETRRADFATLAGLVGAMALLTKYYSVVLFGTLLLVAVLYPTRRQYFRSIAPYITLAIGLLLTLPHIWWMVASGFPTIDYALSKARFDPVEARTTTIMTVLVSLCLLGIPACVSIIAFGTRSRALLTRAITAGFDRRNTWLLCLAYGPFAFTVSAYFIANFRITNAFLMPAFFALPMVFLVLSRAPVTNRVVGRIALSAVLVWLPLVLGSPLFGYYALAHAPGMEVEVTQGYCRSCDRILACDLPPTSQDRGWRGTLGYRCDVLQPGCAFLFHAQVA